MTIRLSARMIALALALLLVALLLVGIAALHAAHSVPWHTLVSSPDVIEQVCNRYLQRETFPTTYKELQLAPVLSVGYLTFAGDDGMKAGQTYRARIEVSQFCEVQSRQEHRRASLCLKPCSSLSIKELPPKHPPCGKSEAMMEAESLFSI